MRKNFLLLIMLTVALAACQTIPAERKNNCACVWETMNDEFVAATA